MTACTYITIAPVAFWVQQIERDGRLLFAVKYLWWLMRYGYWSNPYEIEARKAANN